MCGGTPDMQKIGSGDVIDWDSEEVSSDEEGVGSPTWDVLELSDSDNESDGGETVAWEPKWGNICKYFVSSTCSKGKYCPFSHNVEQIEMDVLEGVSLEAAQAVCRAMKGTRFGRVGQKVIRTIQKEGGDTKAAVSSLMGFLTDSEGNCKFWAEGYCREGEKCRLSHKWKARWGPEPGLSPVEEGSPQMEEAMSAISTLVQMKPGEKKYSIQSVRNGRSAERYLRYHNSMKGAHQEIWFAFTCSQGPEAERQVIVDGVLSPSLRRGFSADVPERLLPEAWKGAIKKACNCHPVEDKKAPHNLIKLSRGMWINPFKLPAGGARGFVCKVSVPLGTGPSGANLWLGCRFESILPMYMVTILP